MTVPKRDDDALFLHGAVVAGCPTPAPLIWRGAPGGAMLYDSAAIRAPDPNLFDPACYGERAWRVAVGGRQSAWFVEDDFGAGVLRHYRRGGLIAHLSRDRYVWQGEARTRSFSEYRMLATLAQAGLNVPRPLAAGYWRHGLTYRAAIIVERIDEAKTLAQQLDRPVWDAVASAIVRMHRAGAWHADLNAFNILFDGDDTVWLIDFDRARLCELPASLREDNLNRLRRSLGKIAGDSGLAFGRRVQQAYWQRWVDTAGL